METAPAAAPVLSVRELRKSFTLHTIDGRVVRSLNGVSFDVAAGEHVAIAGPNGAGKSSLLRCVYRTYLPDSGSVALHGPGGPDSPESTVELTALPDRAMARLRGRDICYVSQFLEAPPRAGALEVVADAARRRGLRHDDAVAAAAAALRRLGVDEALWDTDCGVLSGGERQRINLAAGTVRPPRLLLLDEPASALDPGNRERALRLIESLTGQGVAIVSVFHDADAIARLATRVLVLAGGRITADGPPAQALTALAALTASAVSSPLPASAMEVTT
jgi:alpha-D-ribose 1-methylphosphonate 5-triphosphate synthase subunit PhnL